MSVIFDAIESGDVDAVRRAIADGADINAIRDNDGKTLLHQAAYDGNTEIARLLIEHGANVNAADEYGISPLMSACDGGYVETARLLIERGADVNAVDENLETVIDNISYLSQPEIYDLLRESGAKKAIELRKEHQERNRAVFAARP